MANTNEDTAYWQGWLIDDFGAQKNEVLAKIEQAIHARKFPCSETGIRTNLSL